MTNAAPTRLPIHGFVLAGGKSTRMGRDKATMLLHGRPLIEIAVEKLRTFCTEVSIAGNRDDLSHIAPIIHEDRTDIGPAAGIEAGLKACTQPWALFIPVDVPLVSTEFLHLWADAALRDKMSVSYLGANAIQEPAFCLLQRECHATFSHLLDGGDRRLEMLLNRTAQADGNPSWMYDEWDLYNYRKSGGPDEATLTRWFTNLNTPEDLAEANT